VGLIIVSILSFGAGIVAAYVSTITYLLIAALTVTTATIIVGALKEASVGMMLVAWAGSVIVMQLGFVLSLGVQALRRQLTRAHQANRKTQDQQIPVGSPDTLEM
jgi:hypothetical protein